MTADVEFLTITMGLPVRADGLRIRVGNWVFGFNLGVQGSHLSRDRDTPAGCILNLSTTDPTI